MRPYPSFISVDCLALYKSYLSVEPPENCDQKLIEEYEELTKILICTVCRERVATHSELRQHMMALHNVEVELIANILVRSLRISTSA